jgi:hypothetical protein
MYARMIRDDVGRNPTTVLTMPFIGAASALMSLAPILVVTLPRAIARRTHYAAECSTAAARAVHA